MSRLDGWVFEDGVRCVVCPTCAFTFDAYHTVGPGDAYECPVCQEALLRSVVRRLLDGWDIGNNCDPGDEDEFAWEWSGYVAPGMFDEKREPFEPGVDSLLRSFAPTPSASPGEPQ